MRIVHEGGQQELYHHAFPASKLMAKYPGMCVAREQVFGAPHESVLRPEEHLLLGHKYIIMSCRDVEKLRRKNHQQGKTKEHNGVETLEANITGSLSGQKPKENDRHKFSVPNGVAGTDMMNKRMTLSLDACKINENGKVKEEKGLGEEKMNTKMNVSQGGGAVEEIHCTAKDFYVAKGKSERFSKRKGIKLKKPFSPPLPKGRSYRGLGWQPSLATVQELSS